MPGVMLAVRRRDAPVLFVDVVGESGCIIEEALVPHLIDLSECDQHIHNNDIDFPMCLPTAKVGLAAGAGRLAGGPANVGWQQAEGQLRSRCVDVCLAILCFRLDSPPPGRARGARCHSRSPCMRFAARFCAFQRLILILILIPRFRFQRCSRPRF